MSAADTSTRRHRLTVDEYCRMAEVGLLAPDARVELTLYALHKISEVWLIDVAAREMTINRGPRAGAYTSTETVKGGRVELTTLPGLELDCVEFLHL